MLSGPLEQVRSRGDHQQAPKLGTKERIMAAQTSFEVAGVALGEFGRPLGPWDPGLQEQIRAKTSSGGKLRVTNSPRRFISHFECDAP